MQHGDPLIALRIPPALDQRLRAEAETSGSTLSEIVRDAIEHHLTRSAYPPAVRKAVKAKRAENAAACTHRVRSGAYCRRCERII